MEETIRTEDRLWEKYVSVCAMVERNWAKIFFLFFGGYNLLCWYSHTETYEHSLYWNIGIANILGWVQLPIGLLSWAVYVYLVQNRNATSTK